MKKTLFILLLAAVLVLTGCSSLVKRDSAVDAKQTILTVNGEHVTKQTFLNVYDYNLYTEQQYAQMMKQFGKGGFKMPKGFGGMGRLGGMGGFGRKGKFF